MTGEAATAFVERLRTHEGVSAAVATAAIDSIGLVAALALSGV